MNPSEPPARSSQLTGVLATLVNFPVVFAGLLAITIGADGNDEIALLNLWALWGIAQGLLGQVAQVSGVLDERPWTDPRALRLIPQTGVVITVTALLLSDTLFPGHESWWIGVLLLVHAVIVIGRQRADLVRRLDSSHALVVAALENALRSTALVILLLAAAEREGLLGWGAVAILGPFAVSIALLANRIAERAPFEGEPRPRTPTRPRTVASGVLTGIPALTAYAVVPGLTLLDDTDDLGAIAVAASLLRGPLLVATFLAPLLLERWVVLRAQSLPAWVPLVPLALVAVQLVVSPIGATGSVAQLGVQTVLAGSIAGITYLLVLRLLPSLSMSPIPLLATGLATIAFILTLLASDRLDWLHPFVALGVSCAVIVIVLGRLPVAEEAPAT